ncbi:hypothetical protein [Clostridium sp.]
MYKLFSVISLIIRNYYLPNPFENFQYGVIINFIIEPILQGITFTIVGLLYQRGSAPAWGSFLYLFFYSLHVSLIMLCGMFNFTRIAVAMVGILYIGILIGVPLVRNKLSMSNY